MWSSSSARGTGAHTNPPSKSDGVPHYLHGPMGEIGSSYYTPEMSNMNSNHQTSWGPIPPPGLLGGGGAGIGVTTVGGVIGGGDMLNNHAGGGRSGGALPGSTGGKFCCKCGAVRIDVRFSCCGTAAHARCLYPWPCHSCPCCSKPMASVEVPLPEPFTRNGELIEVKSATSKMRGGRWSEAELHFAEMVMAGFGHGMLPIKEGTRLGTLLCSLLQCTSARLSSKLRTGKKNFKYQKGPLKPHQVYEHEQQQRKLSQQEELFLHYLSADEAAVASRSLQLEWRVQFIGLAQRIGQSISNLSEWQTILKDRATTSSCQEGGVEKGGSFGGGGGDDESECGSLAGDDRGRGGMRGIAPLMVRMAADRRRNFTVQHGVMRATSIEDLLRLLRAGPENECCLLARASNGAILFASAGLQRLLLRDDSDLLGNVLFDSQGGLVHHEDSIVLELAFRQSRQDVANLIERMGMPSAPVRDQDVTVVPLLLRLRRHDNSFIPHQLRAFATEDFLLLHTNKSGGSELPRSASGGYLPTSSSSHTPPGLRHRLSSGSGTTWQAMSAGGSSSGSLYSSSHTAAATNRIGQDSPLSVPPSRSPQMYQLDHTSSSSSVESMGSTGGVGGSSKGDMMMMGGGAGGGGAAMKAIAAAMNVNSSMMEVDSRAGGVLKTKTSEALVPMGMMTDHNHGGTMDDEEFIGEGYLWDGEGLEWCADELHMALDHDAIGGHQGGGAIQDAWGGAYDLCYAPPTTFECTMRTFLQGLPFEAVDVWVPLRDPGSGQMSLQFGGGLAIRSDLSQWIFYSRNFAFYEGQGMPGRVFMSQVPEYREDVASLDTSLFLRRDGAMMAGVHASFGVPVVQDQTVFVLVFYSSRSVQVTQEVLDFIRSSTSSWRIQTTFTPESIAKLTAGASGGGGGGGSSAAGGGGGGYSQYPQLPYEQHAI